MAVKIALAGNPNCGKTTLFNALTGANQYVGNWPVSLTTLTVSPTLACFNVFMLTTPFLILLLFKKFI